MKNSLLHAVRMTTVALAVALLPCVVAAQFAPINDNMSNPTVLQSSDFGTVHGTNIYATFEQGEPDLFFTAVPKDPVDCTVWWKYTAPKDGTVSFDTVGSYFDTVLHVYQSVPGSSKLVPLAKNDNYAANPPQSRVMFPVVNGGNYMIRVAGWVNPPVGTSTGSIVLNWAYVDDSALGDMTTDVPNSVRCDIFPPEAATSARWRLSNADWKASGQSAIVGVSDYTFTVDGVTYFISGNYLLNNASWGTYTVSFSDIPGWVKPQDQIVHVYANLSTVVRGTYTKVSAGLEGVISPDEAVAAGAQWTLDDSNEPTTVWHDSHEVLTQLATPGTYKMSFKALPGMSTPPSVETTLNPSEFVAKSGHYVQDPDTGIVKVQLLPPMAVESGVKWCVDGSDWKNNQAAVTGLTKGTHTITFKGNSEWIAPSAMSFKVKGDDVVSLVGTFTKTSAPTNDRFAKATVINLAAGSRWQSDNTMATLEDGEAHFGEGSLWWTWIAPQSGEVAFDTNGSMGDTLLAVYTGNDVSDLTLVAEDDDSGAFFNSALSFEAVAGTVYRICVTGYDLSALSAVTLNGVSLSGFDMALTDATVHPTVASNNQYVTPGTQLRASWDISANAASGSAFWCELFASKSGGFDQVRLGGTMTESYKAAGLPSAMGGMIFANQTLNTVPDGTYTVMPIINRATLPNAVAETSYANNWMPIAQNRMTVRNMSAAQCDLQVYDVVFMQDDPTAPEYVTVTGKVKNNGPNEMPKPGAWLEVFYGRLTAEGTMNPEGTIAAGKLISTLEAGAVTEFSISGKVAAGMQNRALAVMVDSTDIVPETKETNNSALWYAKTILPAAPANGVDLQVTAMVINAAQIAPLQVLPGDKLRYSVTVKNNGVALTNKVYLELFASQTGGVTFMRGATLTESPMVTAPAPGATKTYTFEQTVQNIGSGIYTPVAVINRIGAAGNIGDSKPLDNRYVFANGRVSLALPATAQDSNIVWSAGPAFTYSGGKVTVTGTLKNVGTGATGCFWTEAFVGTMEALTGQFARGNQLAGGAYCAGLNPGETKVVSMTGNIASGKVIGVLADSTDMVPEIDETDNYDYSEMMP